MYPRDILEREINKHGQTLEEKRMLGEIDHPPEPRIHLDKASHIVTELNMDKDGIVTGKLEVLKTPHGKLLRSLIESGVKLGISSRGTGSVKEDKEEGANIVQEDYNLITFDIVNDPSTPGAWPDVVNEWVEPVHETKEKEKEGKQDEKEDDEKKQDDEEETKKNKKAFNETLLVATKEIFGAKTEDKDKG